MVLPELALGGRGLGRLGGFRRQRIERDEASAAESGATGTPTFFVNGVRHYGAYDASSLVEELSASPS